MTREKFGLHESIFETTTVYRDSYEKQVLTTLSDNFVIFNLL